MYCIVTQGRTCLFRASSVCSSLLAVMTVCSNQGRPNSRAEEHVTIQYCTVLYGDKRAYLFVEGLQCLLVDVIAGRDDSMLGTRGGRTRAPPHGRRAAPVGRGDARSPESSRMPTALYLLEAQYSTVQYSTVQNKIVQ